MSTVEELIGFPTDEEYDVYKSQHGGALIQLKQLADVPKTNEAVILLRDKPANATTTSLADFPNNSGLEIDSVIAISGNVVIDALNNPSQTNPFNPFIFIIPTGKVANDNKSVLKVQMLFITLFHHLLFLGHLNKIPELPNFNAPLEDKFTKLQSVLKSQIIETTMFGKPIAELKAYFETLRKTYNYSGKTQFDDILKYIRASPKEILDFFRGELATDATTGVSGTATTSSTPQLKDGKIDADNIADALSVRSVFRGPPLSLVTERNLHRPPNDNNSNSMVSQYSNNTANGFEGMSLPSSSSRTTNPRGRRSSPRISSNNDTNAELPDEPILLRQGSSETRHPGPSVALSAKRTPSSPVASLARSGRSSRKVGWRQEQREVKFNPRAPPSVAEAAAAGVSLQSNNLPVVTTRRELAHPGSERAAPSVTSRRGLTTAAAIQEGRTRPGRSPQAARNEANRLHEVIDLRGED